MFVKLSFYADLTKMSKPYIVLCYIGFLVSLEGGKSYKFSSLYMECEIEPALIPSFGKEFDPHSCSRGKINL